MTTVLHPMQARCSTRPRARSHTTSALCRRHACTLQGVAKLHFSIGPAGCRSQAGKDYASLRSLHMYVLSRSRSESDSDGLQVRAVCFFVLCKRHWINRVPGAHQGDFLCIPFTLTLTLAMPSYL